MGIIGLFNCKSYPAFRQLCRERCARRDLPKENHTSDRMCLGTDTAPMQMLFTIESYRRRACVIRSGERGRIDIDDGHE